MPFPQDNSLTKAIANAFVQEFHMLEKGEFHYADKSESLSVSLFSSVPTVTSD